MRVELAQLNGDVRLAIVDDGTGPGARASSRERACRSCVRSCATSSAGRSPWTDGRHARSGRVPGLAVPASDAGGTAARPKVTVLSRICDRHVTPLSRYRRFPRAVGCGPALFGWGCGSERVRGARSGTKAGDAAATPRSARRRSRRPRCPAVVRAGLRHEVHVPGESPVRVDLRGMTSGELSRLNSVNTLAPLSLDNRVALPRAPRPVTARTARPPSSPLARDEPQAAGLRQLLDLANGVVGQLQHRGGAYRDRAACV